MKSVEIQAATVGDSKTSEAQPENKEIASTPDTTQTAGDSEAAEDQVLYQLFMDKLFQDVMEKSFANRNYDQSSIPATSVSSSGSSYTTPTLSSGGPGSGHGLT
jgi:hypothetical protein